MKHALLIVALVIAPGCNSPVAPSPLSPNYFLSAVDGHPLPALYNANGDVLVAASLDFKSTLRTRNGPAKLVSYSISVDQHAYSLMHSTVELGYTISDGVLRIDLCPPIAACLVSTELVGPIADRTSELVLTSYVNGAKGSVYRYFPSLPE